VERDPTPPAAIRPPGQGREVTLRLPGLPPVAGCVLDSGRRLLLLDIAEQADWPPLSSSEPTGAFIEFVAPVGLCQLPGWASRADAGHIAFAHADQVWLLRRRDFVRADVSMPVTLTSAERQGFSTRAQTVNLGGGGMLVRKLEHADVGELMEFTLELTGGDRPVSGRARVVRETAAREKGLQFTDVEAGDRDRLVHFVFARQREAAPRG
jgi:hypothetical protein